MATGPLQVTPSSSPKYRGNDGQWRVYRLTIGSNSQAVDVLPATVLADTWAISPNVCNANCTDTRGGTFQYNTSTSWYNYGRYSLGIGSNFGWNQNDGGEFGTDNIIIQTNAGPLPVLNSVVGSMETNATALGLFGLADKAIAFSTTANNNSTLQLMRNAGKIPSVSYSYSAGAYYNNTDGLLILGGYDAASTVPNDVQFSFAPDNNNYLSVNLLSITTTSGDSTTSLSSDAIRVLIDSSIPQLWLPQNVCDSFQQAFGLNYSSINKLYTITNTTRQNNLNNNPSVTFKIANTTTSTDTISITFPYKAFDFTYYDINRPSSAPQSYFPLRVAPTSDQYALGRTFLQEAVVTVDHERKTFTVGQVVADLNKSPKITSILSTSVSNGSSVTPVPDPNGGGGGISGGAIGGIVVAVVVIIAAILGFFFWRRRRNHKKYGSPGSSNPDTPGPLPLPPSAPINEKSATTHELHTPRRGNDGDYFGQSAYAAGLAQHHKAGLSSASNELEGHTPDRGRAHSPAPAYNDPHTQSPAFGATAAGALSSQNAPPAELPGGLTAQELYSRHVSSTSVPNFGISGSPASSPPVNSPISELAPSPGEDGPARAPPNMGWENSPIESHGQDTPQSAERVAISPVRGAAQIRDIRSTDRMRTNADPGIGSSRHSGGGMAATSGPLPPEPYGLGLGVTSDREPSESLRRNDSVRSRTSDTTLVSAITGGGTLPPGGPPSAMQSPNPQSALPRKPVRES